MARFDLVTAGKALKDLLENPDDLPRVFTVIDALQGNGAARLRAGFLRTEEGARLLREEPDIVPLLSDRARLRAMPEGSLAHAYLAFVERENISAQGLVDAAVAGGDVHDDEYRWQRARMRDTHDLWHAVTGYHGDVLGELALLAFLLAQHFQPGLAMVVLGALTRKLRPAERWLVVDGFVRGKRAAWLPSQPWEALLALPVEEVRARLGVDAPRRYRPVRTPELLERRAA